MGASNQDLVITLMIRFCNTTSLFKVVLSFKMAANLSNLNEIGNPSNAKWGLLWLQGPMEDLTTLINFLEAPTATSSFPTALEDL